MISPLADTSSAAGLNLLLTVAYTQRSLYDAALISGGTPFGNFYLSLSDLSAEVKAELTAISADESAHINLLNESFSALIPAIDPLALAYDFSIKGNLADLALNSSSTPAAVASSFLLLAQALEDLGERCYKGLIQKYAERASLRKFLPTLVGLHSIEARHSAFLRSVRRLAGQPVKPWVTGSGSFAAGLASQSAQAALFGNVYLGEDNETQAQLFIKNLNGFAIDDSAATEAFDEVLFPDQVISILRSVVTRGL